jgi:hypothetical protein
MIAVYLLIGVAAAYVLRRAVRTWAGGKKNGCGGGCGCARTTNQIEMRSESLIPSEELRIRVRK